MHAPIIPNLGSHGKQLPGDGPDDGIVKPASNSTSRQRGVRCPASLCFIESLQRETSGTLDGLE